MGKDPKQRRPAAPDVSAEPPSAASNSEAVAKRTPSVDLLGFRERGPLGFRV